MANAVKAKLARIAADLPRPKVKVRKGDRVLVVSGADRGNTGRVIEVEPRKGWARVEGVRMVKKHRKADRARNVAGGITSVEAPISLSNLKVLCPTCGQPTRVGRKTLADGANARVCRREGCGATIDTKR
jgi:large subunit ribosomal protein L24